MAQTFKFFVDSALTTELSGDLVAIQAADGSSPVSKFQLFLGSLGSAGANTTDRKLEDQGLPGTAVITLSITDINPGTGHNIVEVKLGLTEVALTTAVAGDPLPLSSQILSGTSNAVEFWIEFEDATGVISTETGLSVDTTTIRETDV